MKISVLTPTIRPLGLECVKSSLEKQSFQGFEWLVEVSLPSRGHDLNASYNRLLRRCQGELVVSWQDYIKAPPDALQKFWDAYQEDKDIFFTAPVGKTLDWESIEWDWRKYPEAKMKWQGWEIDFGSAPLEALKEIGGFDEELDKYWSCDNVNVAYRAFLAGYKFKHLPGNPAVAYDHNKTEKHPFLNKYNPEFNNERMDKFYRGEIRLEPLK